MPVQGCLANQTIWKPYRHVLYHGIWLRLEGCLTGIESQPTYRTWFYIRPSLANIQPSFRT